MPATKGKKKKGTGAGDKKSKKKEEGGGDAAGAAAAAIEDPVAKAYEGMSAARLEEAVAQLRAKLEQARAERRDAQFEVKTAQEAHRNLKKELDEADAALAAQAREMEKTQYRHLLERRVYSDKMIALQHQHERHLAGIALQRTHLLGEEDARHERAHAEWEAKAGETQAKSRALLQAGAERLAELQEAQAAELARLQEELEANLQNVASECEERRTHALMAQELQRKVEVHASEERRNQHVHDLLAAHELALRQMRAYYQGIVRDQSRNITALQGEIEALKTKAVGTQAAIARLLEENQSLVQPLTVALAREAELQAQLKHQAQTRAALHHAKGRLRFLRRQQASLEQGNAEAERALATLEQERDGLRQSFEACIRRVREENDRRSARLEARIDELSASAAAAVAAAAPAVGSKMDGAGPSKP